MFDKEDVFTEATVVDPEMRAFSAALGITDDYKGKCGKREVDHILSEEPPFLLLGTSLAFVEAKIYSDFASASSAESQLAYCEFICKDIRPSVGRYVVTPFPLASDDVEFLRYHGIREFRQLAAELTERRFALTGEWISWQPYEKRMQERYNDRDRKRKENPELRPDGQGRLVEK